MNKPQMAHITWTRQVHQRARNQQMQLLQQGQRAAAAYNHRIGGYCATRSGKSASVPLVFRAGFGAVVGGFIGGPVGAVIGGFIGAICK
jgi:hypothetical protein